MMMLRLLVITLVLLPALLKGQDAREIIKHYLDTGSNGNIENWNQIRSLYTEGESYYSQNDFEQKVNLVKPDHPSYQRSYLPKVLQYLALQAKDRTL